MVRIGLIGCRNWGRKILKELIALKAEVFVADPNQTARNDAVLLGVADSFATIEELPECDGYVVAVPIPVLASVCAEILQLEKPVFVEEPVCTSLAELEMLQKSGARRYLYAMYIWRYHPGVEALRVIAESGRIGKLQQIVITRFAAEGSFPGNNAVSSLSSQGLSIVRHVLGSLPSRPDFVKIIRNDNELPVAATAMMGSQVSILLNIVGNHWRKQSGVSIHGGAGSAQLRDGYDDFITVRTFGGEETIPVANLDPLYLELKEFISYLAGGPKPMCDFSTVAEITDLLVKFKVF